MVQRPALRRLFPAARKTVCSTAALIALAIVATSCGGDSPYSSRGPRCKVNCEEEGSGNGETLPRQSPALSLDANFWEERTFPLRTNLEDEEIVNQLKANPFALVGDLLKATDEDIRATSEALSSAPSPLAENEKVGS